jgi:hypothetical protein
MRKGIISRIKLAGESDRGVVLPIVIGLGLAMLLLVAVGMSSAASGTIKTNNDEDIKGAISAAYAGVEEYQSRLALDSTYYKFGNPAAPFSVASAAGLTLPTTANYNPAFDATASGNWAQIPNPDGSSNPTGTFYRYEVDNSDYASKGVIRLLSTGKVGNVTESVVANLKQSGFLDFLYFTDFETTDPIFNADPTLNCAVYTYNGRDSDCGQIQFGAFDTLAGPVHSNDTLLICSTTFLGTLTTSNPTTPLYQTVSGNGCGAPVFKNPDGTANPTGAVHYEAPVPIPPTNSQMKRETYSDIPADVPNPGCLYTGPTTITLLGNGKMTVWSPYTNFTETNTAGTVGTSNTALDARCGSKSALRSAAGATIPVVDLNLVYIQTVPSASTDVNYWAPGTTPSGLTCLTQTGTSYRNTTVNGNAVNLAVSTYSGGFSYNTVNSSGTSVPLRYPATNELLPWTSTATNPAYSCRNGDLYVSGAIKGHMTMASDNYIYVTDDVTYTDKTSDILGLVPLNALWVYNPVLKVGTTYSYKTGASMEIDAALLSVAHTVQVQNYDGAVKAPTGGQTLGAAALGARGTLTIFGAIAQKFRGTVATSNGSATPATGYSKNYQYDTRFHNTAPPKFLTPVSTTYKVSQYSGTKAAYKPDGSPN